MPPWLSVGEERRSRSKSPGGDRDRSRSRSNVRDDRENENRSSGHRRSSKKYSESESESEDDDPRYRDRRSSKKSYDPPSDDDERRRRKAKRYDDSESEHDKRRPSRTQKDDKHSRHRDASVSDDDRRRSTKHRDRDRDRSDSEDDKRKSSRRTSRIKSDSDSDDRKSKGKKGKKEETKTATVQPVVVTVPAPAPMVVAAAPYGQPAPYAYPSQPGYTAQPNYAPQPPGAFHQDMPVRHMSYVGTDPRYAPPPTAPYAPPPNDANVRPRATSNAGPQYAEVGQYKYAQVDPNVAYKYDDRSQGNSYEAKSRPSYTTTHSDQYDYRSKDKRYNEDKYQSRESAAAAAARDAKSRNDAIEREKKYQEDKYARRDAEAKETTRRMSRLSMSGAAGLGAATLGAATLGVGAQVAHNGHGKPPASPLLEAYRGTYQSISPMPSALVLAGHKDDSDLSDLDLESDSDISDHDPNADIKRKIRRLEKEKELVLKKKEHGQDRSGRPMRVETRAPDEDLSSMVISPTSARGLKSPIDRKKVKFYDAEPDAKEIAAALKGTSKAPNVKPLIRILPHLTIDDLDALKAEYKKHAKIDGQGINMSKHIKMRVPGYIGTAAYACSLGQWESEGFWANCYYQTGASRRELLIESLMGRTNQQIREIKNFFKDKKYDNDLENCMKKELKADKFRVAILLALQEERMPESAHLDIRLVRQDMTDLYDALNSAGGESAMIEIIVKRSDAHLREVLRTYERNYGRNFARDMINKSRNLVGETLAHILNGALNRPMRDALLLHQAISETAPGKERAELLISRLIRLHWEPKHLEKVKQQYASRYGMPLVHAIRKEIQANMKTEEGMAWTNFCIELVKSSED